MAGGKGERFWPLSTEEKPKQFLKLLGEESMLQMTVKRLQALIPMDRIFIVTGKIYVELVKEQLPDLPGRNIIVEPVGRNTAPCIALSAFIIDKYYKDATIAVLPSDHLIINEEKFRNTIDAGYKFIEKNNDAVVTLGMKPTRPDTGYGYIKYKNVKESQENFEIREVDKFVEKPNLEKAVEYVRDGSFLWNGGMFIWKNSTILKLTEKHLKRNYQILSEVAATKDENFQSILEEKYESLDSISVDYGIMEKADNIYVIPSDFGWDDVGTWHAVERVREKDKNNNICVGQVESIKSNNNIIFSHNKPIVAAGLNNIFIIETEELIYVASKDTIDNIKEIKNRVI
jgi:mannose-1-phosphate guanylyltransferase